MSVPVESMDKGPSSTDAPVVIGASYYQIEIAAVEDEAENLRRFDAAWQSLRQKMFGPLLAPTTSPEV